MWDLVKGIKWSRSGEKSGTNRVAFLAGKAERVNGPGLSTRSRGMARRVKTSHRAGGSAQARGENEGHPADQARSDEEPGVGAQRVVDGAARIGAQPHPYAGDEEDEAVGGAHAALTEVLAREDGVERHRAAIGDAEDGRETVHGALTAREEIQKDHARLERKRREHGALDPDAVGDDARPHPAEN